MLKRNRFSDATAAENAQGFAGIDEKTYIVEDDQIAKGFGDMLEGDIRFRPAIVGVFDDRFNLSSAGQWFLLMRAKRFCRFS